MYKRFWLDLICRNAFMDEETEFHGIVFNLDYHEIGCIGDCDVFYLCLFF
jgi:hypothetical protein